MLQFNVFCADCLTVKCLMMSILAFIIRMKTRWKHINKLKDVHCQLITILDQLGGHA